MVGVNIDSPLQAGFMLRSLLPTYHGMVKDFKLGQHSLTAALLQMIVDQCTSYDKDPWKRPVGKDGKPPRSPSATTAGASVPLGGNDTHPFKAMATLNFNKHFNHWQYNCKDGNDKYIICCITLSDKAHASKDCPIPKQIGYKLVKRLSNTNVVSRVGSDGNTTPTVQPPAPAPASTPSVGSGSGSSGLGLTPEIFTVATELESYDSGSNSEYKGKYEGKVNNASTKPNLATYLYPAIPALACLQVSTVQDGNTAHSLTTLNHSTNASPHDPMGVLTISLPRHVMVLL